MCTVWAGAVDSVALWTRTFSQVGACMCKKSLLRQSIHSVSRKLNHCPRPLTTWNLNWQKRRRTTSHEHNIQCMSGRESVRSWGEQHPTYPTNFALCNKKASIDIEGFYHGYWFIMLCRDVWDPRPLLRSTTAPALGASQPKPEGLVATAEPSRMRWWPLFKQTNQTKTNMKTTALPRTAIPKRTAKRSIDAGVPISSWPGLKLWILLACNPLRRLCFLCRAQKLPSSCT